MTDVIGHVAGWLRRDTDASEPPVRWNPARLDRLQKWLGDQCRPIVLATCQTAKGELTEIFDEEGRQGKIVSAEEGARVLSLIKEQIEALIKEACLVGHLDVICIPMNQWQATGHSTFRTEFTVAENSPVPPEFR